ncbi:MAG: Mov34/MPN/PAD-1 family protein, partial [Nitrospirae bacterium]|nr:Mov34/MPN/PAD-1 family protein [Nitrospirota bacterium]
KLKAVAQVHSHPKEAFHSDADDRWAIINHVGAMSLVLPYFALYTSPQTFVQHAVVFEMSIAKKWEEVFPQEVGKRYRTIL